MNFDLWLIYFIAIVFLCLTPGPNSLLALSNGARYGVIKTVYSSLGCAVGSALIIAVSVSGMGVILATSPEFFLAIKILGALYLIYLGLNLIFSKADKLHIKTTTAAKPASNLKLFLQGFAVVTTNPKAVLFFIAFLPQFYHPWADLFSQYVVLAATFVLVEFPLEMTLAAFSHKLMANYYSRSRLVWFNRITGGIFITAGGFLFTLQKN